MRGERRLKSHAQDNNLKTVNFVLRARVFLNRQYKPLLLLLYRILVMRLIENQIVKRRTKRVPENTLNEKTHRERFTIQLIFPAVRLNEREICAQWPSILTLREKERP